MAQFLICNDISIIGSTVIITVTTIFLFTFAGYWWLWVDAIRGWDAKVGRRRMREVAMVVVGVQVMEKVVSVVVFLVVDDCELVL